MIIKKRISEQKRITYRSTTLEIVRPTNYRRNTIMHRSTGHTHRRKKRRPANMSNHLDFALDLGELEPGRGRSPAIPHHQIYIHTPLPRHRGQPREAKEHKSTDAEAETFIEGVSVLFLHHRRGFVTRVWLIEPVIFVPLRPVKDRSSHRYSRNTR
jgi:hypothetical protein